VKDVRPEMFLAEILAYTGGLAALIWVIIRGLSIKLSE
jgi:hypothetical protein